MAYWAQSVALLDSGVVVNPLSANNANPGADWDSLVDTVLDEQPSTSKAAKQAASKARRKGKEKVAEENAKQDKQALSPEDVFKKPMAPAPRSKRGRMSKKELENLRITLPNATVAHDETESVFDSNTSKWNTQIKMNL